MLQSIDSKKTKQHFLYLYIGLISITAAFITKYTTTLSLVYYIFLGIGIISKIFFLLYSFRNFSHVPFKYFMPLVLGVIFISLSMYAKYVLSWLDIATILVYIAIPLKIIGISILIIAARKNN